MTFLIRYQVFRIPLLTQTLLVPFLSAMISAMTAYCWILISLYLLDALLLLMPYLIVSAVYKTRYHRCLILWVFLLLLEKLLGHFPPNAA